jgi:hypothetical protein
MDEAAKKWEEFQNQPAGGEPQQKGACSEDVPRWSGEEFALAG